MKKVGGGRQYLLIDLASEQWEVRLIPSADYDRYPGGEALGLHLWSMHSPASSNSTAAETPLCFACGALTGSTMMCSSSLSVVGQSPATNLVEADTTIVGAAEAMASCGWRAIVLTGIARRPMVLHVSSNSVDFIHSERLIGKTATETIQALQTGEAVSTMAIGPAGENAVAYACIVNDELPIDRHGFGAVLGEKHIKALTVDSGSMEVVPADSERFAASIAEISSILAKSPFVDEFKQKGPLGLIDKAMNKGFAAVDNNSKRTDPRLFHLSGKECARRFSLDATTCVDCPLSCQRKVMRPGGEDMVLPDAMGMMALGSNLGNYDPTVVMQWWQQCVDLGLHPVSTGMLLGWVMAAQAKSLLQTASLIRFGETDGISETIDSIARGTATGQQFAQGSQVFTQGSWDDALSSAIDSQVLGRGMLPVDPRGAWGEALLIGRGEDFPRVPEVVLDWLPNESTLAKAEWVVIQENLLAVMRSVGICPYLMVPLVFEAGTKRFHKMVLRLLARFPSISRSLVNLDSIADLLSSFSGVEASSPHLMDVGRRVVFLKQLVNDSPQSYPAEIPERFSSDPESNHEGDAIVPYRALVGRYRFLRALDLAKIEES